MAEVVGAAVYEISADDGKFLKTVSGVKSGNASMQKDFIKTDKITKQLTTSMTKLAVSISSALTIAALTAQFKDAIVTSREFGKSISNLSAITGAVGDDLKFLSDAAKEFGSTTTLSATQAATALKLVASAKPELLKSVGALKAVTKEAITLAEAAGIDLPTAASALTTSLTQFNLGAEESSRVINVLAAGAKEGASEIAETVSVINEAGGVAAGAKISFEELNGAVQALAKGAVTGAEAGTKLRNILAILESGANKKTKPSIVGLSAALGELARTGFEDTTKAVKLFGRENFVAAQALIKHREEASRVTKAITDTNEAYRQASTNTNNLDGDILALGSAFESLQIQVGDLTDDEMRAFVKSMTTLVQAITGNQDALKEWGSIIDGVGIAAQATAFIIAGKLIASMVSLTASAIAYIKSATAATVTTNAFGTVVARTTIASNVSAVAIRGLSGAMALLGGPVGIAVIAAFSIIALARSFDSAAERSEKLKRKTDELVGSISDLNIEQAKKVALDTAEKELKLQSDILEKQKEISAIKLKPSRGGAFEGISLAKATNELNALKNELAAVGAVSDAAKKRITELTEAVKEQAKVAKEAQDKLDAAETARQLELQADAAKRVSDAMTDLYQQLAIASREAAGLKKEAEQLNDEFEAKKLLGGAGTPKQIKEVIDLLGTLRQKQREAASAQSIEGPVRLGIETEEKGQTLQDQLNNDLISEEEFLAQKLALQQNYDEQLKAISEERFRRESVGNEFLISSLDAIGNTAANVFGGILSGTMSAKEAMAAFAQTILNQAIGAVVQLGIEYIKNQVIQQSAAAATTAASAAAGAASVGIAAATGTAIAAAYAPAAALASLATFGGNAIPASAGILSTTAIAEGVALTGALENGGPASASGLYQVGENNKPEVFQSGSGLMMIPGDNGRVFNQNQLDQINSNGGNGGNMTINQNINVSGTGDKDLIDAMGRAARDGASMARREFMQSSNDKNGAYFNSMRQNFGDGTTSGRLT